MSKLKSHSNVRVSHNHIYLCLRFLVYFCFILNVFFCSAKKQNKKCEKKGVFCIWIFVIYVYQCFCGFRLFVFIFNSFEFFGDLLDGFSLYWSRIRSCLHRV